MRRFLAKLIHIITERVHDLLAPFVSEKFLASWKPIHLCWWFDKHGFETPTYFIGTHVTAPIVTTDATPSSITSSSVIFDSNSIDDIGGENATARGICWVTGSGGTPTTADTKSEETGSFGVGSFSRTMSTLSAGTTYSVRAYAINSAGTGYGSTVEVTTLDAPSVTTSTATSVSTNSAQLNGNVTSDGGDTITERGFVYSSTDSTPTIGEGGVTKQIVAGTTGTYNYSATSLGDETTYYYQAYATNSVGTTYGGVQSFTTIEQSPTVVLNSPADTSSTSDTTPDLTFTGTDAGGDDIRYNVQVSTESSFGETSTLMDSYDPASPDTNYKLQSSNVIGFGQAFTADGNTITSCEWKLRKVGSPTGNIKARIYNISGTYGTSAVKTGTALLESSAFDVSTLSTSYAWITFDFLSSLSTSSGNKYIVALEIDGSMGNASNYVESPGESTSATHSGNHSAETGVGVSANASWDRTFRVYYSTLPIIDAVSGTDAGFSGTPDNTDPFTSGQQVTYTVQSALSTDTYYWRVRGIDPSGSNTYGSWATTRSFDVSAGYSDLVASAGTLSFTGTATGLTTTRKLTASAGTLSFTGTATGFSKTYNMTASAGALTFTGTATGFTISRVLTASAGTLTLTGTATALAKTSVVTCGAGTFTISGSDANFARTYAVIADTGSLTFTGTATGFTASFSITASSGTFTLTAGTTNLSKTYIFTLSAGTLTLTGTATALTTTRSLTASAGTLSFTGTTTGLIKSFPLTASAGSFTLTGTATGLTATHSLTASAGAFTFTGTASALTRNYPLTASAGSLTFTGTVTGLTYNAGAGCYMLQETGDKILQETLDGIYLETCPNILNANTGTLTLSGTATGLTASYSLTAGAGTLTFAGTASGLAKTFALTAEAGALTLTGTATNLTKVYSLTASVGSLTLSGSTANFLVGYNLIAGAGSLTLTGTTTGFTIAIGLTASSGSLTLSGSSVGLLRSYALTASAGSLTFTGTATAITFVACSLLQETGDKILQETGDTLFLETCPEILNANAGTLTFTGSSAVLTVVRPLTASAGSLTFTGTATTFGLTRNLSADAESLTLSGSDVSFRYTSWTPRSKNSATWTPESKNSATWTPESKNSATWTPESKNSATWTPATKNPTVWK